PPEMSAEGLPSAETADIIGNGNNLDISYTDICRKHIDEYLQGIRSFEETLDDFATVYACMVLSNKRWGWKDIVAPDALKMWQKRKIKAKAIETGKLPKILRKPGTGSPDFEVSGVIYRLSDSQLTIFQLPKELWHRSDRIQFKWLDAQLPGGVRPEGYTWHHSEIPGRMELVPYGLHRITYHTGGRKSGNWAAAKR
ncbi:MAG: HNH endonuclease, partial [Acutalibacteraceae bacterium]